MAKWQIYLFTFCFRQLRKIASDIKCQHMKQGDEIWRLSVQFIGRRISFFFLSMKFSNGGSHLWELYYILSWHGDPPMILPNIILTCFRQWFLACHTSESEKCPCPQSLCLKFQHGNAFCHRVVWSQTEDDSVSEKVQIMQVTMFVLMFAVLQGWQTSSASLCIQKVENIRLCMTKSSSANPRVKSSLSSPCLTFSPHPSSHASTVPWIISIGLTSI